MKIKGLAVLAATMTTAMVAPASAQTIDFEVGAPQLFAETSPLTSEYASLGVTFYGVDGRGGSILNDSTFGSLAARSGTNFLAFNSGAGTGILEWLTFSSAISAFNIYLGGFGPSAFTAIGYDADGLELASATATTAAGGEYANLALTGSAIKRVQFSSTNSIFAADDLSFTAADATAAVPEPATWAMMIVGFGAIGFAMRRRKSKVTTTVAYA